VEGEAQSITLTKRAPPRHDRPVEALSAVGSYRELGKGHLKIVDDHALPTNISIIHSIKFQLEPDLWKEIIR
jgi:hypothetical protein